MVEQLSKGTRLSCSSCVDSITCIKGLVQENGQCIDQVAPSRRLLIQIWIHVEHKKQRGQNEHQSRKRNHVWGHPHREDLFKLDPESF
ncbi:hypothetical protein OGATHE_005071 [Ogataea polymorpha]|uniref:Uncharacterized protein n=1 Tax=Ogataea polymorpha TaxID=460523 RepID=A0A9P8T027_9ASCO|nr:hypothetical protein OGATHE_005071 [Ogataea polymorpha]